MPAAGPETSLQSLVWALLFSARPRAYRHSVNRYERSSVIGSDRSQGGHVSLTSRGRNMSKLLSILLAGVFAAVTITPVAFAAEKKDEAKKEMKKGDKKAEKKTDGKKEMKKGDKKDEKK
jgi:hypothetical protein